MDRFKTELPASYEEVYHIDATGKKTGILLNLAAFGIMIVLAVPFVLGYHLKFVFPDDMLILYPVGLFGLIAYLVLHELTHGAAYKLLTRQKLTFGFSWSCAFCGVPDIYTSRATALTALAAPLVVFTVLLLPLTIWLGTFSAPLYMASAFIFCMHLSGCVGDIYMLLLLLFRYKDPALLMKDTGPAQSLYLPRCETTNL